MEHIVRCRCGQWIVVTQAHLERGLEDQVVCQHLQPRERGSMGLGDLIGMGIVILAVALGLSHNAGGFLPSAAWGGGTHSTASAYQLARDAGFSTAGAYTMAAIAGGESGFCTEAVGDQAIQTSKWGPSVGPWQIRALNADTGTGRLRDVQRLTDPVTNARAARTIYLAQGFTAWGAYSNGSYRPFLGANSATHTMCKP